MQPRTSEADPTLGRATVAKRKRSVLCVDDDPHVLALCSAALRRAGFEVETVSNGWEALRRMNDRRFDAVLLDLLMPALH